MKRRATARNKPPNVARLSDDELRTQVEYYMQHFDGVTGSSSPRAVDDLMSRVQRFKDALKR